MALRRDAAPAVAELVLAVEARPRATDGLLATVGRLDVAARARRTSCRARAIAFLDVRHADDAVRAARRRGAARAGGGDRARPAGSSSSWDVRLDNAGRRRSTRALTDAAGGRGRAGSACPTCGWPAAPATTRSRCRRCARVAMLFVRCAGGLSHHPAESVARGRRRRGARRAVRLRARAGAGVTYDLIVRGGAVVADGDRVADVGVLDGAIAAHRRRSCEGAAHEEVDARGLLVLPGAVDAHVHLNDPGRADWEGFATGTAALAAGGTTTRDRHAAQRDPADGRRRGVRRQGRRGARASRASTSRCGAAWCPATLDRLDELADARRRRLQGVHVGQRRRRSSPAADDLTLLEGMARAARSGCRSRCTPRATRSPPACAARAVAAGRTAMRDYLASRPVVAELEAIERAIALRRRRPAARCTSSTSAPAAAWRWSPRRGRAAST